jgi:hypothetical protein
MYSIEQDNLDILDDPLCIPWLTSIQVCDACGLKQQSADRFVMVDYISITMTPSYTAACLRQAVSFQLLHYQFLLISMQFNYQCRCYVIWRHKSTFRYTMSRQLPHFSDFISITVFYNILYLQVATRGGAHTKKDMVSSN